MASPTFVQEYEDTWAGTTSPKTISVTVAAGDTLVIGAIAESAITFNTPTGGSLTYTLQKSSIVSGNTALYLWTAPCPSAQTFTLSLTNNSGSQVWGFNCLRYSGVSSIGASVITTGSGAPSLALTTTGANSTIVTFIGDWAAVVGTTRTWRTINSITPVSGGLEKTYLNSGQYTVYAAYYNDAGAAGSKTTGMTTPSTMTYTIASIELIGSGPNQGSAAVADTLGIAATGARKSQGSVSVNDNLSVAATGSRKSQGSAAVNVTLGVAGVGHQPPARGSSALNVTVGITTATGSRKSKGSAAVADTVGIAASGLRASVGSSAVNNQVTISATGIARVIPIRILTPDEIIQGNRTTSFYLDVLDADDAQQYRLDGLQDGHLDWTANALIKGSGQLTVVDVQQTIDWLSARLRPVMVIEGLPPQPLGVFLASEAPDSFANGRSWAVKLLDKTTILDQDTVAESYALAAGTVATTAVIALITSAGITNYAVTPSAKTLDGDMVWSAGTGKLHIINDILDSINYFSLYSNFLGQMIAEPYVTPANRPIMYEFIDGPTAIYVPEFTREVDIWNIPNRVTLIGVGDGTGAALTSTVDNTDPTSPYSQLPPPQGRGRVIGRTETGVEAADQATLDALALTRLIQLTNPTDGIDIAHAPVPGLAVNMATHFRRQPADMDDRRVVSKTSITLNGTALATSTLNKVVDL